MTSQNSSRAKIRAAIGAVVGIGLTIVIPIVWDLYRQRVALELQLLAQSTLVESPGGVEKLQVAYDKQIVRGLSRVELALVNNGRRSIRSDEVVAPIRFTIDSGRILDVRVEQLNPTDLQVRFKLDTAGKSLALSAPLLNPGDAVRFTLLIGYTPPPLVRASARIEGLRSVSLTDRRREARPLWKAVAWQVYPAAGGTAVAFLLLFTALYRTGYYQKERHVWRFRSSVISQSPTLDDYNRVLALAFRSNPVLQSRVGPISIGLPEKKAMPQPQQDALERAVERYIREIRLTGTWIVLVLALLAAVGAIYVVQSIASASRGLAG